MKTSKNLIILYLNVFNFAANKYTSFGIQKFINIETNVKKKKDVLV